MIMQVMAPGMEMGSSGMGMQMSMESPGMGMQMGMMSPGGMLSEATSPNALTPSVSPLQSVPHVWSSQCLRRGGHVRRAVMCSDGVRKLLVSRILSCMR